MSKFLEDLKNAADKGEFNSDAAKKILEVHDLANKKIGGGTRADIERLQENLEERQGEELTKPVTEEKTLEVNTEYEKKMSQFKKQDTVNKQLATLIEIEDMVKLSIEDMFSFTDELETKFEKEFETEDSMFGELNQKIEEIKLKYNSIIN